MCSFACIISELNNIHSSVVDESVKERRRGCQDPCTGLPLIYWPSNKQLHLVSHEQTEEEHTIIFATVIHSILMSLGRESPCRRMRTSTSRSSTRSLPVVNTSLSPPCRGPVVTTFTFSQRICQSFATPNNSGSRALRLLATIVTLRPFHYALCTYLEAEANATVLLLRSTTARSYAG
jgi:hypothetical protein